VFTWGFEGNAELPPGSSTVEVTLQADGDGTIVRLHHDRLPTSVSREQHAIGWQHSVDRLAIAAAGGDPGLDWNEIWLLVRSAQRALRLLVRTY